MKNTLHQLAGLLALCILSIPLQAQEKKDYTIALNSGKFIPDENAKTISPQSDVLQKSLFQNKQYVVIQFFKLPDETSKAKLKQTGIELLDYIPNLAYTAAVTQPFSVNQSESFGIRSVFRFTGEHKTAPAILQNRLPGYAIKKNGYADVNILTYEKMTADKIDAAIKQLGAEIITEAPLFRTFTIRIPDGKLALLAELPFIQWTEFVEPPNQPDNLPGRSLHRVNILNDGLRNLKGDGINMGIWDGGTVSPHLDFSPGNRLTNVQSGTANYHGTHVSGTMAGRGLINPMARGMAPNAAIYSYDYNGDVQVEMSSAIPAYTLISSNHSYHDGLGIQCGLTGANSAYSLRSRNTDINLNNFPYHLHCHSAGNAQTSCAGGWTTISGAGKPAKNNIVVANVSSAEVLSGTSSVGPVHDGRIKPEISGMGTNVFSTYTPLNTYGTISGTSMSTPGITGSVALLVQRYKQLNADALPPSALIKNIVCNTARDIGNPGPDYRHGFGRINTLAAVRALEENRYELNSIATGGVNDKIITVPAGAVRLRAMITWNDPAAAANAAIALVNNLNLSVINSTAVTLPWILDPNNPGNIATQGVDNISNIEQVTIENPAAGDYTLRVEGAAITTGATQGYSLTWVIEMPSIEIIYPNGPENLNPGSTETITWDNAGVTGNQTIEYSLDNGGSWTVISNTIPAATTRLDWIVPSGANTATALIRVSDGVLSDVSDAGFKILGTPAGFSSNTGVCSGQVNFSWTSVANATHYDVYSLDAATGEYILLAADINSTSYTASGLAPGASMWFTIRAKNSNTGAVSERAIAVNQTVSSVSCNNNCPSPAGLNVTSLTSTGVTLNWAAAATALSYTAEYKPASSSVWITAAQNTTALSVNISGLAANTIYNWRVQTNCTGGGSNYTAAQFTTPDVCPGIYDISTNGSISGAATIPFNTDIKGLINPSGDNDYYKFVITTGGTITLTLTALPANYHLRLLNSTGTTLQSSTNTGTTNETISRTVTPGTYYARVYPSGTGSWNASNCYTLKVQLGTASGLTEDEYTTGTNQGPVTYPNPAKETLNILIENLQQKAELKVYNATGKLVMQQTTSTAATELNIEKLPAGIYMIKISEGGRMHQLKFVKK